MKLERFADDKLIDKVIWLDELQFRLNWTLQLTVTTTSLGLHLSSQTGRCSSFAAISDGLVELSSEGLIGSHFFGGESCLHDSETVLWPAVRRGGLNFFQDGAPAHYSLFGNCKKRNFQVEGSAAGTGHRDLQTSHCVIFYA